MPPEPPVRLEVISARAGRPASLPAPTPGPTPLPTPGPGLMSCFSCTATGAPRNSANWSFIASRPTPAALRRAFSISPGGLFGCGWRASGTRACLIGSCLGAGMSALARFCTSGGLLRRLQRLALEHQLGQPWRQFLGLGAIFMRARHQREHQAGQGRRAHDPPQDALEPRFVVEGDRPRDHRRAKRDGCGAHQATSVLRTAVYSPLGRPCGLMS